MKKIGISSLPPSHQVEKQGSALLFLCPCSFGFLFSDQNGGLGSGTPPGPQA